MFPFESIAASILDVFPELRAEDISVGMPPKRDLGDVALPLFLAAKKLKCAPNHFAGRIAAEVRFGEEVLSATPAGPYLNLRLKKSGFAGAIVERVLAEGARYGSGGTGANQRVLIEHTSINPNASPHVGRARNAMIGDSISRLFRFEGYAVETHYYVNDMGRQIGLLVLLADELKSLTFDEILAAYVEANARAAAEPEFAARGYALLAAMEEGDAEAKRKFHAVAELCLRGQVAVLERLGIAYDYFDYESDYLKDPRLEPVLDALRSRGALIVDEDERLVVDLSKLGYLLEEGRWFVLMRANGSSMYGYRDLAYTIDKAARAAGRNLIVLGEDHKLYAQQLALILGAAGHASPEPIYYSYILLKDGKMSTRAGKVVLLSDFLDQAEELAAARVAEQSHDLNAREQEAIAKQVAVAAIRFTVLRVGAHKNVTFDMETSLSFQGDTGPYIQYSCARIQSILRKHGEAVPGLDAATFRAEAEAEWALAMKLNEFPGVIQAAVAQRTCAGIAVFALEVAHAFTAFYHECPVLAAETETLKVSRLQICAAALQTLRNALGVLGIEVPKRM